MALHRYLLIALDVVCDSLAECYPGEIIVQLYIYLLQDLVLLIALLVLLLQFFREKIVRARLVCTVIAHHWALLALAILYLVLVLAMQSIELSTSSRWRVTARPLLPIHLLKRLIAILYYFALSKPISIKSLIDNQLKSSINHITQP